MIPVFTCRGWDSSVKRLTSNYGVYVYLVVSDSFETPWTVTCHAPLSMEFSRQEYWSGLPFSAPLDLPDPGMELTCLAFPVLAGRFFTTTLPGKPCFLVS